MNTCKLHRHAQQLPWLDMNSEAGQEYWLTMTLVERLFFTARGATPAHRNELGIIPRQHDYPSLFGIGQRCRGCLVFSFTRSRSCHEQAKNEGQHNGFGYEKVALTCRCQLNWWISRRESLAYKDIEAVITAQRELVDIQGKFFPRIVRMNKD